jgi:hypothetical protein
MKIVTTIAEVIRLAETTNEVTLDELAAVRGGEVPPSAPQYVEFQRGMEIASQGSDRFWEGAAMMAGATVLPPPADLAGAFFAGGRMVNGAEAMDRGEAIMDRAQADYDASHQAPAAPPPPPPPPASHGSTEYQGSSDGGAPNMSISPNMSMSDGGISSSGTPVIEVHNEAGGASY